MRGSVVPRTFIIGEQPEYEGLFSYARERERERERESERVRLNSAIRNK